MISWIVATNDLTTLYSNLIASLHFPHADDELVVVEDPESITRAYAEGQARATKPIRCYIHHDVQIADLARLRAALAEACSSAGLVGVTGSRDERIPWWDGDTLGSVFDTRIGHLNFGPGGECSMLDGLLLATVHDIQWDVDWPGFHGYDHDACTQLLRRGFTNLCIDAGHEMVRHNTKGPRDPANVAGWDNAVNRYRAKWEVPHGTW